MLTTPPLNTSKQSLDVRVFTIHLMIQYGRTMKVKPTLLSVTTAIPFHDWIIEVFHSETRPVDGGMKRSHRLLGVPVNATSSVKAASMSDVTRIFCTVVATLLGTPTTSGVCAAWELACSGTETTLLARAMDLK